MDRDMQRRLVAEFLGTFWLVFGGCGAAVLAAAFPQLGIGFTGVAFAFGLTVLTMAYAVGHISGGHFNPAVTLGLWSAGRCANKHVVPYIVVQVVGAICAVGGAVADRLGQAGLCHGRLRLQRLRRSQPGQILAWCPASSIEVVLTFFFLMIIIGTTSKGAATGFAGIPIGLALTLIHLISIPVTNTSVNPARSTAPALFAGGAYVGQLWLFWVAPILGAMVAGFLGRILYEPSSMVQTVVIDEERIA